MRRRAARPGVRRILLALAGGGLTFAAVGCNGGEEAEGAPGGPTGQEAQATRAVPVSGSIATAGELEVRLRATTTLRARETVEIVPRQAGIVQAILTEEGRRVREGEELARLDDEQWRLQLEQAAARHRALGDQLARARALQDLDLVSSQEVQALVSDSAVAEAELSLADLAVRNARVRSPINGIVTHRFIQRGEQVTGGEPAFTVADVENLEARLAVPERDAVRIEVGQEARILLEEGGEPIAHGVVERIRPVVDPGSGTVQVTVALDAREDARLRPGQFVNVDIVTDVLTGRVTLPRTAVVVDGARPRVFIATGGIAEERDVTLGHAQGTRVEIVSGVAPGDTVVIVGQDNLRADAPLRLMEVDGSASTADVPAASGSDGG